MTRKTLVLNVLTKISIIFIIVVTAGGALTFVMTWRNIGFVDGFFISWITSFALCVFCIAPIGGIIAMLINKSLQLLLPKTSPTQRNILFGLCMALIMECIMSVVTTYNLSGFSSSAHFISVWFASLVAALPLGVLFSILLSVVIKPKLAIFWAK